jgi:hypothetical protein
MDGENGQRQETSAESTAESPADPGRESSATSTSSPEHSISLLALRRAADAQELESDAFLQDLFVRLSAVIDDMVDVRWAARGPRVVAAAARTLACHGARLDAAQLRVLHDIETRDDVVPRVRSGVSRAAAFLRGTGTDAIHAARDAAAARLACGESADLPEVGAAYAGGEISRAHLDVAVRTYERLGAATRNALMPVQDPRTAEVTERRCVELVDATLAEQARRFSVPEFTRIAEHLVQNLNPPEPGDAHRRRYLHLSRLADGSVRGRFAFGPAQALTLTAVLAALAGPRPGMAVDADGVEHDLSDERDPGQRRADALIEAIDHNHETCHCRHQDATEIDPAQNTNVGVTPTGPGDIDDGPDGENHPDVQSLDLEPVNEGHPEPEHLDPEDLDPEDLDPERPTPRDVRRGSEPPPQEGELQIRRPPGARTGPYPQIEIVVTATLEHLAQARHHARGGGTGVAPGFGDGFAHAQHAGGVHPTVLGLLACSARLRRLLLDDHGAVLRLGRAVRLASPAQKQALYGRDVGCVIPGCGVPGDLCEVHHVVPWVDGGRTDIDNLVFACPRHHVEVTDGTWEIEMIDGVPWARPPGWVHPGRPLLRNASHRAATA